MFCIKQKCYRLAKFGIGTSIINMAAVLTQEGNIFRWSHRTHPGRLVRGTVDQSRRKIRAQEIGTGRLASAISETLDIAGK